MDAATQCDQLRKGESVMLMIKNGLAPNIDYNLILHFILSEADAKGKPSPKVHMRNPPP